MKPSAALLVTFAAALVPSLAWADDTDDAGEVDAIEPLPPPSGPKTTETADTTVDTVHLRNGGMYRGRVTEIVPGDHVTILVAPGSETKRIAWPEVDRVIVASTPIPPPPPSAAPAASAETPAPMTGPRVRVHITSKRKVILYRTPAGTSSLVQACTSPCDVDLPLGDTYRIAGSSLSQTKELRLQGSPGGSVDIVVDPPSTGGMIGGGLIAGTGATAAYVGLLMALIGAADTSRSCYGYPTATSSTSTSTWCASKKEDGESLRDAGLVTMLAGTAVMALGIVVFVNSATTDIAQRTSASRDAKAKRNGTRLDAFLRTPTWRTGASSSETATQAPAAAFPVLFTGRF